MKKSTQIRKLGVLTLTTLFLCSSLHAQTTAPIQWQVTLGGGAIDVGYSIQQTKDTAYIVAGASASTDGDVTGNHGLSDYWIVKTDTDGNLVWEKSLGGSDNEYAKSVQQTTDGGFIVAGYSYSLDGDITGHHDSADYWIVKLDAAGALIWEKSLGGNGDDHAFSIQQTSDGGYIVAGWTTSTDGDVSENHGLSDYWLVKLNGTGSIVWEKSFGGLGDDQAFSIQQTADGGFIVAGGSLSDDSLVMGNHGLSDYWILRLDSVGNLVWQKLYGGTSDDEATKIQQTADNGFIVAGWSLSNDMDVSGNYGLADYWIIKLDGSGTLEWQDHLGGSLEDVASSIQQTTDGGFIVAGKSESPDEDISYNIGKHDYWIVKLDAGGNVIWEKCYGGSKDDIPFQIQQTMDSGYIIGGWSVSTDIDVTGNGGLRDFWVVKLKTDLATGIDLISNSFISVYPNPVQNQLTIDLPGNATSETIEVYNVQGKKMIRSIAFENNKAQLNTSNLPAGFYTIQLRDSKTGMSQVTRFVKAIF